MFFKFRLAYVAQPKGLQRNQPKRYICLQPVAAILCTGGPDVIKQEAWPFYRTNFGVRLCWELEEPKGPTAVLSRRPVKLVSKTGFSLRLVAMSILLFPFSFLYQVLPPSVPPSFQIFLPCLLPTPRRWCYYSTWSGWSCNQSISLLDLPSIASTSIRSPFIPDWHL